MVRLAFSVITVKQRIPMDPILENRASSRRALDPTSVAVLGIHWQNDLLSSQGAFGRSFAPEVAKRNVVQRTAKFIASARSRGARIVFINVVYDPNFPGLQPNNALFASVIKERSFLRNTQGAAITSEFELDQSDIILEHTRISAFHGTDLLSVLYSFKVRSIALTGIATNVAVDHTARDAAQYGFDTYLIEDCCCASNDEYQAAALLTMKVLCTEVLGSSELLVRLK